MSDRTNHIACGIDFGTSNSTVATVADGQSALVPIEDGKTTLPSAIFFPSRGAPLFGRQAATAYRDGEEGRLMRGLKKILGTSLMDEKTTVSGRAMAFTDILKIFMGHLKSGADVSLNRNIEHVVLGRPVHFHDDNPEADRKSEDILAATAKATGFSHVEFLFEPIAAAFAHESTVEEEKLALVIDLGGGTSDFTVIRVARSRMGKAERRDDILGTSGVRIGGTTFDYRLSMKSAMPVLGLGSMHRDLFDSKKLLPVPAAVYAQLSDWAMVNHAQTQKAADDTKDIQKRATEPGKIGRLLAVQTNHLGHALLEKVEEAKIGLTDNPCHDVILPELGRDGAFSVTREDFNAFIAEDVDKIFKSVTECLAQANTTPGKIELIILTGGSTELPVIDQTVRAMFPQAVVSQKNKLDSVGLGLAYRANSIFG